MDEFSYLSVLLSIIIGLAVTQLLTGMRGQMLGRDRVSGFWPKQVWAGDLAARFHPDLVGDVRSAHPAAVGLQ